MKPSSYVPMRSNHSRSTANRPPAMVGVGIGAVGSAADDGGALCLEPALPPPAFPRGLLLFCTCCGTHRKLSCQSKPPRTLFAATLYSNELGWITSITGAAITLWLEATRLMSGSIQPIVHSTCASRKTTMGAVLAAKPRRRDRTRPSRRPFSSTRTFGESVRTDGPTRHSEPSSTMRISRSSAAGERPKTDATVRRSVGSASSTSTITTDAAGRFFSRRRRLHRAGRTSGNSLLVPIAVDVCKEYSNRGSMGASREYRVGGRATEWVKPIAAAGGGVRGLRRPALRAASS